jgi:hypothetical protein
MTTTLRPTLRRLARATALCAALAIPTAGAACAASCTISANDHVIALNEIQNLMGRYSHLGQLRGEGTLAELFAMNTQGTSWHTPGGPTGLDAMKARFAHPDEELTPGVLHLHAMFTPVIEVAGAGKTAKGVWDSFGASVQGPTDIGGWLCVKYGVDFVKEAGAWKIWHMQVYPVFSTKYDKSITQTARERAARNANSTAGAGADRNQPPPGAPPGAGPGGPPKMPAGLWIYDGKSVEKGPFIPVPYCHFDTATIYQLN